MISFQSRNEREKILIVRNRKWIYLKYKKEKKDPDEEYYTEYENLRCIADWTLNFPSNHCTVFIMVFYLQHII